ncbi:cupin domain-containing protein [Nocardioides zhouii]|uniref:Cupin domain-containing protein n=1 Tax=Nocardioides zhouii TaxID=1168729 RepID=A0A4Q2T309_9ACTN|nr:cupin domain-containing protein [Nocardioides zhouii]RYC11089.1 cupin domain-containing protein [Nocardioides zhouii]
MHLAKQDIPTRIDVPGAVARQLPDFGSTNADEAIGAEYFSLGAGTDIAPLLVGLENDLCQSPHWGYLISGEVVVSYSSGESEQMTGGDVFFWPAGHSVAVRQDAEIVLFSPQVAHGQVIDHLRAQLVPAGS